MLPEIYFLTRGSSKDKALLFELMNLAYSELFPHQSDFSHLKQTLDRYLGAQTPIWWVKLKETASNSLPIAGLWAGNAVDQVSGDRYIHIFLLYVYPSHRRQGIATTLIKKAEDWAIRNGNKQISLQVFTHNQPALSLYQNMGFQPQSLLMLKSLKNL